MHSGLEKVGPFDDDGFLDKRPFPLVFSLSLTPYCAVILSTVVATQFQFFLSVFTNLKTAVGLLNYISILVKPDQHK